MKINYYLQHDKMKRFLIVIIASFAVIACGKEETSVDDVIESEDLSSIRAKKQELSQQQNELATELDKLDDAIRRLDPNRQLPLVGIDTLELQVFNHYAEVQGDVTTKENIIIYPEYSGILTRIYVKEGDKVGRGQTLATIDDGGLRSQLAQAESQLSLAKTTFERQKRLWDQNIGSEIQFLEAKTNYESMQNSVNQLKSQVAKTVVTAPFSGTIDEVISEQGEVVNPGQSQLFRLLSLDKMYVEADVPENYLGRINKGSDVIVQINSIGQEFEGKVREVSSNINPSNRTFRVQVDIPKDAELVKPNQIATLLINDYKAEDSFVIPESSIQKNAQGENIVYTFNPGEKSHMGTAAKRIIETGYVFNDSIEVKSGLEKGSLLITDGARSLRDGQEVKTQNAN